MAKCVRKNCKRLVSPLPEAKRKRLCKKHYLRFCELSERKKKDLVYQINKYIPRKIKRLKKGEFTIAHSIAGGDMSERYLQLKMLD